MEEDENENENEIGNDMLEAGPSHDIQNDRSVALPAPRLHKLQDLVCNNFTLWSSLPSWQAYSSSPPPSQRRGTVLLCLELQTCVHNAQ